MELIDSHAHIDFPQFAEDRDAMLERARAAGVTVLLAIGTGPGPEKLDSALPFAELHDWIYATVGIHPHEAKEVTPQQLEELARLAQHRKVIAWGEIGLDYYYDHSPREVQARVFQDQMDLENTRLHFARRMIVVIVESNFAPSDDFPMLSQPCEFFQVLRCDCLRFVGMYADSGVNPVM